MYCKKECSVQFSLVFLHVVSCSLLINLNIPLHCFFIGLILSINSVRSYKTAQVLVIDGEGVKREIWIKYYQSNDNNLAVNSIYMVSCIYILQPVKLPQVCN